MEINSCQKKTLLCQQRRFQPPKMFFQHRKLKKVHFLKLESQIEGPKKYIDLEGESGANLEKE